MPQVMIGCPVRNRGWILPRYLQHLTALNYPQEQIEYCFVINDSIDDTESILLEFTRRFPTRLLHKNSSRPGGWERGFYQFSRLAELRNRMLEEFLQSPCDYLFSVDSDILVPPNCLGLLMQADEDVVSALVCNGEEIGDNRFYNVFNLAEDHLQPIRDFPRDRLFPVECTGAAYLLKRRVISAGVRYNSRWGPEDIGFCQGAREQGFTIYCHGAIECRHIMKNSQKYRLERQFSSG